MKDLTVGDPTQRSLLEHLRRTETLLSRACAKESAGAGDAEIVALSDLGLANNVRRMLGGFFTGAFYRWQSQVPLVPIDATVNVCSVSLHRLGDSPDSQSAFDELVAAARATCARETGYRWNLADGNHFATLGTVAQPGLVPAGDYLVLHASAAEHKRTPHGLYPEPGVWYEQDIRSVDDGERELRYLAGASAERFIARAHELVALNEQRHRTLAELICGDLGLETIGCRPHYGMPDDASVAIGCHWLDPEQDGWYILLTEPGDALRFVVPHGGGRNAVAIGGSDRLLTPHGLGLRSVSGDVRCERDRITIDGTELDAATGALSSDRTTLRSLRRDPSLERRILASAPGAVAGALTPRFTHDRGAPSMPDRQITLR